MKLYFKTERADGRTFYGCHVYMNDQIVDRIHGSMEESENDTLNILTKNMLKKLASVFEYDKLVTLKYADLDKTKYMTNMVNHDIAYQNYHKQAVIMTSPSVFLSDIAPMNDLKTGVNRYKITYNYYTKKQKIH